MSSTIRRGTSSKLSQNSSIIAAIIRFSAIGPGRFSSRHIVGCEHRSSPLSGSRPTAILKAGSVRSAFAVIGVGIACGDQQRAEADHLGNAVAHSFRIARILEATRQTIGDAEPALDLGQHQNAGVRGQPAAIEGDMHRLAADG